MLWIKYVRFMGNSGACWGLSMKELKARIKVHIKLRKGKDRKEKVRID